MITKPPGTLTPFRKILIANRSEIALRITRSARELGYRTVAVYSDIDATAKHIEGCDEAVYLGATPSAESYLNIPRLIAAAQLTGADAVHPGYGFLAENAEFAMACAKAGLIFIGPSPAAIAAMGDKARAKILMREAGLPCIPGYDGEAQDDSSLREAAARIGFPLMIKAAAGGGGRGIRRVDTADQLGHALRSARSEATTAFGDARVILEKIIEQPRHVEVQIFGDRHGKIIHLGERDCSVQRRYQKLIEEAPSPAVDSALRHALGEAAVRAAAAIDYEGAGTVEFLLDREGRFYFMEMNTRLQVEHTVTEEITGLDLVALQLRIATGEQLPITQQDVEFRGHSIQVRLCSEDPAANFMPQGGRMHVWEPPAGLRVEHALESGSLVPPNYDSMIAKLIVKGRDREEACRRLESALLDLVALGPPTNQMFLAECVRHPVFRAGQATTAFIDDSLEVLAAADPRHTERARLIAPLLVQLCNARDADMTAVMRPPLPQHRSRWLLTLDGTEIEVIANEIAPLVMDVQLSAGDVVTRAERVAILRTRPTSTRLRVGAHVLEVRHALADGELLFVFEGRTHRVRDLRHQPAARSMATHDGRIRASMGGRVVAVHAAAGESLVAGQPILTIEAMKIEHTHVAPMAGTLGALYISVGQQVTLRQVLAEITATPGG